MKTAEKVNIHHGVKGAFFSNLIFYITWLGIMILTLVVLFVIRDFEKIILLFVINLLLILAIYWGKTILIIDKASGKVIEQNFYFFLIKRTKVFNLDKIKGVQLSKSEINIGDRTTKTVYPIRLTGVRNAEITPQGNHFFARKKAKQIADILEIPFLNKVYVNHNDSNFNYFVVPEDIGVSGIKKWQKSSTVNSSHLWNSLLERWEANGKVFERTPCPPSNEVIMKEEANNFELAWSRENISRKYSILFFILFSITTTALFYFDILLFALFFTLCSLILLRYILAQSGKSGIRMSGVGIAQKHGVLPWKKEIPYSDFQEFIVNAYGIYIVGDIGAIEMNWSKDQKVNQYLYNIIPYQFQRLANVDNQKANTKAGNTM